jgi:exoribonuclease II
VPHLTRDANLNNLAALLNAAPVGILPDTITTLEGYSALMRWV